MTDDVVDALPLSYTGITCLLGPTVFFGLVSQWHSWDLNLRPCRYYLSETASDN